jgi:hypothetical protein
MAEKLDTKKMEGLFWADKRCRKLHMVGIPFSRRFKELDRAVGFWNKMLREQLGNHVISMKAIQRLMVKKTAIPILLREICAYTLEQVQTERSKNFKAYSTFLGQAGVAQATWLEELAEHRAAEELKQGPKSKRKRRASSDDDTTDDPLRKAAADQLWKLWDIERIHASARRVKAALGVNRLAGITMVAGRPQQG